MTQLPAAPEDHRPGGNQFSLRGMFLYMTVVCVILALLALGVKQPQHWLGMLGIPLFCFLVVIVIEIVRVLFPPKTPRRVYLPPVPANPLQTAYFTDGESPFAPPPEIGQSPFGAATAGPPAEPQEKSKESETG
jgi:hypothetical protein